MKCYNNKHRSESQYHLVFPGRAKSRGQKKRRNKDDRNSHPWIHTSYRHIQPEVYRSAPALVPLIDVYFSNEMRPSEQQAQQPTCSRSFLDIVSPPEVLSIAHV